jgi:hypothetical protein
VALQIEQQTEATSERKNGGLLGGYKEVSTDDDEVMDAAKFAAEQLSQRSNSLYPFKVKEVINYCSTSQTHQIKAAMKLAPLVLHRTAPCGQCI